MQTGQPDIKACTYSCHKIKREKIKQFRGIKHKELLTLPHTAYPVVKVDRRIRWHYTTTILRLRIGARLTRYRNCKFHNFARTISRHADNISRYFVPPSAGPLLPLRISYTFIIR